MKSTVLVVVLSVFLPIGVRADENEAAESAFCNYLLQQATAQRDLLRSPSVVLGPTKPDTGTPPQMVYGLTSSVADIKKASLTMQAARTGCALNTTISEAQEHIYYGTATIERAVLLNRLDLIDRASAQLDRMASEEARLVEVHNVTRPAVYHLQSAKLRLDVSRATTLAGITSPYVPQMSDVPLRTLIADKQQAELANQKVVTRLANESGWDIKLAAGARTQLGQFNSPTTISSFGGYGTFMLTYNLGRHSANNHFDNSVLAYVDWKSNKFDDVTQKAAVLKNQIQDALAFYRGQLKVLLDHNANLEVSLKSVEGVDTSNAFAFKNELFADKILLQVDIDDVRFRVDQLEAYLRDNF